MTQVLITVDTELSLRMFQQGVGARANFESSILGRCAAGDFGIGWQMDRLDAYDLRGVFFVDPLSALLYGPAVIADTVALIEGRGHEVQLHIHTEWLEWVQASPVGDRRGRNIAEFSRGDQRVLLGLARDLLIEAGAPPPTAFRAGNYGASDETLAVLAELGLAWDSSFNPGYLGDSCRIALPPGQTAPVVRQGLAEVPLSGLMEAGGQFRHAQICALSATEMAGALSHAAAARQAVFMIVTHSFEMLSRDRQRPNRLVMRRFEHLCRTVAGHPALSSATFGTLDPAVVHAAPANSTRFQSGRLRTVQRIAEQAVARLMYERALTPA